MTIKPQGIKITQILITVVFCIVSSMSAWASENPERSIMAADIIDQPVFNSQGKELGELEDLVIKRNESVKKTLISIGGVLEVGEKLVCARYKSVKFSGDKIILDVTQEQLNDQPEFDYRKHGLFTTYHYRPYGLMPDGMMPGPFGPHGEAMPLGYYERWRGEGDRIPRSGLQGYEDENQPYGRQYFRHHGRDTREMNDWHLSWNRAYFPARMLASIVLGQTVINKQGEEVATVEDLIINAEGKIKAFILSYGDFLDFADKLVAVPFRPIGFTRVGITYDITSRELKKLPKFSELQ